MLEIIVILAVSLIVIPLIEELATVGRTQTILKAVVYILTLLWLVYMLFSKGGII
jgi:hypothetical protein